MSHYLVILDAQTLGADLDLSPLSSLLPGQVYHHTRPEAVAERLRSATIAVSNKVVLDEQVLQGAERLQLICVAATGTNNVALDAAAARGIPVCNVPAYSTPSTATHTLAMYFYLAHHLSYHDHYTRSGAWCQSPMFTHLDRPWPEPVGKTWGILGMGRIGSEVARMVSALGFRVVYHSTSGKNRDQPFPHLTLDQLLGQADVVSLHAPLTDGTRCMIAAPQLQLMKPNALIINTSRGGLIQETDLASALDAGVIAGAGLDVLEQEPPPRDHPLSSLRHPERLLITPHIAGLSYESRLRLRDGVCANIQAFLEGRPANIVNGPFS